MYEHFDVEPYSLPFRSHDHFESSTADVKVVVVRNPYDRLLSAVRTVDTVEKISREENKSIEFDRKKWIADHSNLSLHTLAKIQAVDYRVIDFYNLSDYIAVGKKTVPTYSVQPAGWERWMSEYYTKQQMESEYQAYEKIMQSRPRMNTREWHRLTTNPAPNNNTIAVKKAAKNKKSMSPEKAFELMLDQAFGAINENTKLVNQSYHTIQTLQKRIEVLESELNKIKNH